MPLPPCTGIWRRITIAAAGGADSVLSGRGHTLSALMCWFDMFYSPELARRVYNNLSRWWISPSRRMTKSCSTGGCDSRTTAKAYSPARLNVIAGQLVTLIDEGYTSGSQLVAMQTICCNVVILNKRICFMVCCRQGNGRGVYDDAGAVV